MQPTAVRPYRPADADAVRRICAATSSIPGMKREPLLTLYCDYYIEQEPQHCFVLADGDGAAVGYVLAAADWTRYCRQYKALYGSRLQKQSRLLLLHQWLERRTSGRYAARYPAHLHINILPEYQRQGQGRALLDALMERLAGEGVTGVMLGVGAANAGAVRFYERYGFRRLGRAPGCYIYGYEICG